MGTKQSAPAEFPTSLHFQHALARTLSRGIRSSDSLSGQENSSSRPGLPTELVILILRYAEVVKPYRVEPGWSMQDGTRSVGANGADIKRAILFMTPPLDRAWLTKTAALELATYSKDQGWCSNPDQGSWSWFEVGIVEANAEGPAGEEVEEQVTEQIMSETPEDEDEDNWTTDDEDEDEDETESVGARLDPQTGEELRWNSHHNKIAGRDFEQYFGEEFGPDHEIWSKIKEGDRLGVWMCARFGGWSCQAEDAKLRTADWFEPTLL